MQRPCGRARIAWRLAAGCVLAVGADLVGAEWGSHKNRFGVRSHVGFNLQADFTGLGGYPAQTDIGPATAGADHVYDDGFNRVDASGNAQGGTWYWGYQNASQVPGNDTLLLSSSTAPANAQIEGSSDDPQGGLELTYARQLGWNSEYWWGIEVGLSWLDFGFQEDRTLHSDGVRTTDTYALGGVLPPLAPYRGTYTGPGPLLGDHPTRQSQTIPGAAVTTGRYQLEGTVYGLRLGLIYESQLTRRLVIQFGGGGVGALVESDFLFRESVTLPDLPSRSQEGRDSATELVGGAYAEAGLAFHLTESLRAKAGAQYQYLSDFNQPVGVKEATLDFQHAVYVAVGVDYGF